MMVMKKRIKMMLGILLCVCLSACGSGAVINSNKIATTNDGQLMKQTLQYYQKGQFKKATDSAKRLSKVFNSEYTMSEGMKKAYNKLLAGKDVTAYYLYDIDNDGKPELCYVVGEIEASMTMYVVSYKNKLIKDGSIACGHSVFNAYPQHNGMVMLMGQMGYEEISLMTLKNNKLKVKTLNDRENVKDYLPLGLSLNDHTANGKLNRVIK